LPRVRCDGTQRKAQYRARFALVNEGRIGGSVPICSNAGSRVREAGAKTAAEFPATFMTDRGKPIRSKLEPHFELIMTARRERMTWAQIAALIQERGTDCTPQGVASFIKARGKRRYSAGLAFHRKPASSNEFVSGAELPGEEITPRSEPAASRMPQTHPRPYSSPLWPHLETIRALRRKHETWRAIASHLNESHGLKIGRATVLKFFKRAAKGRLPIGFADSGASTVVPATSSPRSGVCPPDPESREDPLLTEISANDPFANLKRKYEQTRRIKY